MNGKNSYVIFVLHVQWYFHIRYFFRIVIHFSLLLKMFKWFKCLWIV